MSIDRFGVPDNMFGRHDDDFYGGIGRVAVLASLLEYHLRTLGRKLVVPDPHGRPILSVAKVISLSVTGLARLEKLEERETLREFLTEAKYLFDKRNAHLHSIWPAQDDGKLFGWKPEPYGGSQRIDTDQLRLDVQRLVQLNQSWSAVWALVSGRSDLVQDEHL